MASGQRTGRKPAEGQVGLVDMPTSRALELTSSVAQSLASLP